MWKACLARGYIRVEERATLVEVGLPFRGETRTRRVIHEQILHGIGWEAGCGYPTGRIYTADVRTGAEEGGRKFLKNYTGANIFAYEAAVVRSPGRVRTKPPPSAFHQTYIQVRGTGVLVYWCTI